MDVERLRRMAGDGDQDARAELSRRMVRRLPVDEMVDVALRDGSMTTAVKALDAAASTGLLGYSGRNDRHRWQHMAHVVAAYRKRVLLHYLGSGMMHQIWVLPKRARGLDLLGSLDLRAPFELIPKKLVICRTPHAHQKDIWKHRDAHILTEQGVELALFRSRHHVAGMRRELGRLLGDRSLCGGRGDAILRDALRVARSMGAVFPRVAPLIGDIVARILITGEVTT